MNSAPCCVPSIRKKDDRSLFWMSLLNGFLLVIILFFISKKQNKQKISHRINKLKSTNSEDEFVRETFGDKKAAIDNLTIISGIGPVISDFLISQGISTFEKLSTIQPDDLKELLIQRNLRLNNAETWPHQAKLASLNQWQALESYIKEMKTPKGQIE